MSNLAQGWAWQQRGVRGLAKFTLIALADHSDDEGICWPGRKGLAEKMGISERTVTEHIATLINLGLLESFERFRQDGSQTSNYYRLAMIPLEKSAMGGAKSARPLELVASGGANLAILEPSLEPLKETSIEKNKEKNTHIPRLIDIEIEEPWKEIIETLHRIPRWDKSKDVALVQWLTSKRVDPRGALDTALSLVAKWEKYKKQEPYATFQAWINRGRKDEQTIMVEVPDWANHNSGAREAEPAPVSSREQSKEWERALSELELQVSRQNFRGMNLKSTRGWLDPDGQTFHIETQTAHQVEWIDRRIRPLIEKTLKGILSKEVRIEVRVKQEVA